MRGETLGRRRWDEAVIDDYFLIIKFREKYPDWRGFEKNNSSSIKKFSDDELDMIEFILRNKGTPDRAAFLMKRSLSAIRNAIKRKKERFSFYYDSTD